MSIPSTASSAIQPNVFQPIEEAVMSIPSTASSAIQPNIFQPIEEALEPTRQYESTLERLSALPKPILLPKSEISRLLYICERLLGEHPEAGDERFDLGAAYRNLNTIKEGRMLSSNESQICASLEARINAAAFNAFQSILLMTSNLKALSRALTQLSELDIPTTTLTEGPRELVEAPSQRIVTPPIEERSLPFPEVAAVYALHLFRRDATVQYKEQLGAGSYGCIREIIINGSSYAEKTTTGNSRDESSKRMIDGAIRVHALGSSHFARIACIGSNFLIMERGSMSLKDALERDKDALILNMPRYVRQMLEGLVQLHQAGLVHRDIKIGNMILVPNLEDPTKNDLKYIDFDSIVANKTQAKVYGTPSNLSPQLVALLPSRRGSRSLSPVSSADDIWALGISIYQILSDGNYPFTTNDNVVSALLAISRLTQEDLTKAINALESNDRLRRLCDSNSLFVLISVLNYLLVLDPTDRSTGAKDALDFLNRFDRYSLDHLSLDQTRSESTSSVTIVESPPILEGSPLTTRSSEVSTPPSELEVVEFIPRRNPLASPPLSRPPIRGAESPFSLGIAMISPRMISPRRVTVFGRSPVAPTLQPEAPAIPSRPRIRLENAIALDQLCSGEQRILPRRPEGIPTYQRPGNSRRRQILLVPRERINSLSAPGYPTSS